MTGAAAQEEVSSRAHGLTLWQGAAMYVGAVLGTGVIALPALAAEVAGPASLLAWLGLVILSIPLAATFAALGALYPDAGGVSTYVRKAFGIRAAGIVGWCFYFAVPPGSVAAGIFAGTYVAAAIGGGRFTIMATAVVLVLVVTTINTIGVTVSGRLQLLLVMLLTALLLLSVITSLPHGHAGNLHPFAPHGWLAVGHAASLLVWSFAGWEAITHLAAEFKDPQRDMPKAANLAVALVGVLYMAVAFASIFVLGSAAGKSGAPLAEMLAIGTGGNVRILVAVVAVFLTLGTMNAYFAGAAKLGAALGRDGSLPAWLASGSKAGEVPRRSLAVVSGLSFLSILAGILCKVGASPMVLLTTGSFVTVYLLGTASALRLLPKGSNVRRLAVIAFLAVLGLLVMTGWYLLWPLILAVGALLYIRFRQRRDNRL
jgi:amino acid efflux transporter